MASSPAGQLSSILPQNYDNAQRPLLGCPSSRDDNEAAEAPSRWSRWTNKTCFFWLQSKGMILVMLSQFFGASMNVMTQYLERNEAGAGMDPFQVCPFPIRALETTNNIDPVRPDVNHRRRQLSLHVVCASP